MFTNNGTIEAEYVIVAASLGTLKRNLFTFAPALPSALQTAIKRLGCDVSDKVVMEFPVGSAASWGGPKLEAFYHIGDEPDHHGEFVENWNINHYSVRFPSAYYLLIMVGAGNIVMAMVVAVSAVAVAVAMRGTFCVVFRA